MAALSLVALARTLIDIDSTTGREAEACRWLAEYLRASGFAVTEQPVADGRANLLATLDPPAVVLSTHIDCVPPFFPSRIEDGRLHGRGACDAKGILAAQITAALRLRESGERRVGLLFVVGEERGSDGAAAADALAAGSRFLVDGEPTDSKLGLATRGVLRLKLLATGRAAHSSQPQRGVSAIDKLIDALVELRGLASARGSAARADLLLRRPRSPAASRRTSSRPRPRRSCSSARSAQGETWSQRLAPLRRPRRDRAACSRSRRCGCTPSRASPTDVFAFTTDIPLLARWGRPLLFGPGSILLAHSDDEHVTLAELEASVDTYVAIARELLRESCGCSAVRRIPTSPLPASSSALFPPACACGASPRPRRRRPSSSTSSCCTASRTTQRWGDDFLAACAETWGDRARLPRLHEPQRCDRAVTATRRVRGHVLVVGGRDLTSAGDESVARQAEHVQEIVARLQARHGLGPRFSIVAHSMGGLVARRYIADHPGVVTGLVTLGTPHHGSPLANEGKWVGFFAHATDAIVDLQPERCAVFNARYPASEARLAEGGRIYTIRGGVASSQLARRAGCAGARLDAAAHGPWDGERRPRPAVRARCSKEPCTSPTSPESTTTLSSATPCVARRAAEVLP